MASTLNNCRTTLYDALYNLLLFAFCRWQTHQTEMQSQQRCWGVVKLCYIWIDYIPTAREIASIVSWRFLRPCPNIKAKVKGLLTRLYHLQIFKVEIYFSKIIVLMLKIVLKMLTFSASPWVSWKDNLT